MFVTTSYDLAIFRYLKVFQRTYKIKDNIFLFLTIWKIGSIISGRLFEILSKSRVVDV